MGVIGDLARYQQYQMGSAILAAAQNPSSGAGQGLGLGAGFALAQQMVQNQVAAPAHAPGAPAPPPPPGPAGGPLFHVSRNGQTEGPFPLAELGAAISAGRLGAATLVWSPGMAAWLPASQVPALAAYCNMPPPPPPPPPPVG
jgi:hypothetical protein